MSSPLSDLRRARRTARLDDQEWFDVAYRFYLWALAVAVVVIWLSSQVNDEPATAAQLADIAAHGPAVLGLVGAFAVALGVRSGSDGGPIALEPADVRYLMMAPIAHADVLRLPVLQRIRTAVGAGALVGAIAGHSAASRMPGTGAAWTLSGAAAGAVAGALFVGTAVVVHALAWPRWVATSVAVAVVVWQCLAVATPVPGPFDTVGSLALWGWRQHPIDLVIVVVALGLLAAAWWWCGRLRIEALARRADLVTQLRFAATMQDLRTVVLLRRQLQDEHPRSARWWRRAADRSGSAGRAVWHRGLDGAAHTPVSRLVRMTLLAVVMAVATIVTIRGTTPAALIVGVAGFVLGLEAAEPMSQEVDHPDRTDEIPRPRGWVLMRHLPAVAATLVPFALLGAIVVAVVERDAARAAFALCLPVTWMAACGSIVSIVRDAPDPVSAPTTSAAMPAEFAGFTTTLHAGVPLLVSAVADLPVVVLREYPEQFVAARLILGLGLVIAAVVAWVRHRDAVRLRLRRLVEAGRTAS